MCSFEVSIDLGARSCRDGASGSRVAATMFREDTLEGFVSVTIALGFGGAKPPVMPFRMVSGQCGDGVETNTFLKTERIFSWCDHCGICW